MPDCGRKDSGTPFAAFLPRFKDSCKWDMNCFEINTCNREKCASDSVRPWRRSIRAGRSRHDEDGQDMIELSRKNLIEESRKREPVREYAVTGNTVDVAVCVQARDKFMPKMPGHKLISSLGCITLLRLKILYSRYIRVKMNYAYRVKRLKSHRRLDLWGESYNREAGNFSSVGFFSEFRWFIGRLLSTPCNVTSTLRVN